jgi:hypothetical protein
MSALLALSLLVHLLMRQRLVKHELHQRGVILGGTLAVIADGALHGKLLLGQTRVGPGFLVC